jgi:hypothetical protein
MFCPQCKAEYRPGLATCPECNVRLVESLPTEGNETEYVELVTVFVTSNQSELLIAKSLLDSASIEYFAKGEGLVDVVVGRLGFNPAIGPIELQVHPDDAEEARAALEDMEANFTSPDEFTAGCEHDE